MALCRLSAPFDVLSTTSPDEFPIQFGLEDKTVFCRTRNRAVILSQNCEDGDEITCPSGYIFDSEKLICVGTNDEALFVPTCTLENLQSGQYKNPDNCNSFFNYDGVQTCTVMACPGSLLYNVDTKQCDYPKQANCCEYQAKNSKKLL